MKRQKTIKERICTMNYLMLLCMVLMLIFIIPIDPPNPFPWDLSRPIGMKKLGQFFVNDQIASVKLYIDL